MIRFSELNSVNHLKGHLILPYHLLKLFTFPREKFIFQICLFPIEQENPRFCLFWHLYWNFLMCSEYFLMDEQLAREVETVEERAN